VKDAAGNEIRRPLVNRFMRESGNRYDGAYPGAYPLVGTPDDIVADMVQMSELGLTGTSVAFLDYLKEIPFFVQEVLPRLARLGLRREE
jgi:alkanesulfonate monooxygenase SsuD/methylene tetrahydromethanopterin reductase-like flavin-dependent oxidoreductase (luciferase family)